MPSNQQRLPATGTVSMTACPRSEASRATLRPALAANGILAGAAGATMNMSRANANKCRKDNATLVNILVAVSWKKRK